MQSKRYFWGLILFAVIHVSCLKTAPAINTNNQAHYNESKKYILSLHKKYGGKQKDTLLAESIGNYSKFLARTDYLIGIMILEILMIPIYRLKSTSHRRTGPSRLMAIPFVIIPVLF